MFFHDSFKLHLEEIFARALKNDAGGVRLNGIPLENFRYADGTILLPGNILAVRTFSELVENII